MKVLSYQMLIGSKTQFDIMYYILAKKPDPYKLRKTVVDASNYKTTNSTS